MILLKVFQFLRLPNLIIVGLTQYLIRYSVLYPYYKLNNISFFLSESQFLLLVVATVLLTAGGYVINDLYDFKIDKINKPDKVFIGKYITQFIAIWIYWLLNITGFLISFWIAIKVSYLEWLFFYPLGWFLLWYYSFKLKKSLLWGNILVSFFCAFVALLVWFSEKDSFQILKEASSISSDNLFFIISFYGVFAFISNMLREITKDMEDVRGDKMYGCKTLPIIIGYEKSQQITLGIAILLLILILLFIGILNIQISIITLAYCILSLIIPISCIIILLLKPSDNTNYNRISLFAKLLMLSGLLLLPVMNI